jgi:hypothetical protein
MPPPAIAPPIASDRAEPEELAKLARRSLTNPILKAVLESAEGYVMVLNAERQILACNTELLETFDSMQQEPHRGERPGEALGCVHAAEGPAGCGTSQACARCGAALAIQEALETGAPATGECSMNLRRGGHLAAIDFQVKASILTLGCHALTVVVFQDISARKRKDLLESIFLHDLSNTLQSLIGWSELVADGGTDPRRAARRIVDLCQRIRHEVSQQRLLHDAEKGTLAVCREPVDLSSLLEELRDLGVEREHKGGPRLALEAVSQPVLLHTDRHLLLRVLQNMVRNALEATSPEGTVTIHAECDGAQVLVRVSNPGVIPEGMVARIFHRSHSTKGAGRGLGTYGMKLISEDYLGGTLSFHSSPEDGTCFILALPLE